MTDFLPLSIFAILIMSFNFFEVFCLLDSLTVDGFDSTAKEIFDFSIFKAFGVFVDFSKSLLGFLVMVGFFIGSLVGFLFFDRFLTCGDLMVFDFLIFGFVRVFFSYFIVFLLFSTVLVDFFLFFAFSLSFGTFFFELTVLLELGCRESIFNKSFSSVSFTENTLGASDTTGSSDI